jgi:hypothetical protein
MGTSEANPIRRRYGDRREDWQAEAGRRGSGAAGQSLQNAPAHMIQT